MYYIGIDGGGTKTAFGLFDDYGKCLYQVDYPTCHFLQVGFDGCAKLLKKGIEDVVKHFPDSYQQLLIGIGIAGYGNDKVIREQLESHIEKENEIEMNFKATLNFKNEIQGKVEGSINYNKERYALIKGEKGEIYVPMFNRVVEYTIHLENEVIQKTYPIEGDDMTLEIQALINHNQSTHTLQDSKKLQETIEKIREEAK